MKDEIIAAVAQGWCTKENENKTMDSTLAMAIVDNVIVVIEKLEKHERLMAEQKARLLEEYIGLHIKPKPRYIPRVLWRFIVRHTLEMHMFTEGQIP